MIRFALLFAIVMSAGCAPQSPLLRNAGDRLPARVELTATPFFAQEEYQCGPAALATVLNASGASTTPADLVREIYLPGRRGSLQTELIAATRTHGRLPYILAPTLEALVTEVAAGRPVLVLENRLLRSMPVWHYAVVIGYDRANEQVILRSGTTEREVISTWQFQRRWGLADRWALLPLEPGEIPARPDLERYMTAAAGLEATGKADAAAAAYERAQSVWPQAALPWLGMANLHHARGDLEAAQRAYVEAIERDPANVAARNNLAETLAQRGCATDARREIARATELARGSSLAEAVAATAHRIASLEDEGSCPLQQPPAALRQTHEQR